MTSEGKVIRKGEWHNNVFVQRGAHISERDRRLEAGEERILYHATDPTAAEAILSSGIFRCGGGGMAGGGIYFATNCSDTFHKAQARGSHRHILQCRVKLGRTKMLPVSGDKSITFEKLLREGFDSVLIPRPGGDEFVVYKPDQCEPLRIV